jgi:hypothetical protein
MDHKCKGCKCGEESQEEIKIEEKPRWNEESFNLTRGLVDLGAIILFIMVMIVVILKYF